MKQVWKYQCNSPVNMIGMPEGAEFLHYGLDTLNNRCVWMLVDPRQPITVRTFYVYGTGWDVDANQRYLATSKDGLYMWHLFEAAL